MMMMTEWWQESGLRTDGQWRKRPGESTSAASALDDVMQQGRDCYRLCKACGFDRARDGEQGGSRC